MTFKKFSGIIVLRMEVEKMLKLDYSLSTPEERKELVEKILEENPNVNDTYLETLADYLIIAVEK